MNARGEAGPRSAQSGLEIMTIMKKTLLLATILAITALTSCTEDTYVGEQNLKAINEGAISFGSATPAVTRASGGDAATLLNNNFVLFGYKTLSSETQTVFDNYQVNYVANTAHTTESNTANWEYVSYKNLPYGTTTTENGTLNDQGVAANATASGIEQSIKYWDFSASQYNFFAYSLGAGEADNGDDDTENQYAKASPLSNSTYTLEGTQAQLGTCYISNKKSVSPSVSPELSATQVQLEFRSFLSKIQLKFYETIPGYSVKDVKFYPSAEGSASTTPYLYTLSEALPTGGKYTVTFDENDRAQLTLATSNPTPTKANQTTAFETTLTNYKGKDYKEADNEVYLGRASNDATATNIISMLPNPQNTDALHLKMDFTLVSRDGTGETINMTGATAVIPAAYAMWKPNYEYTYIFKISDNTNAKTAAITGLYPITLDATVTNDADGTQETITTVDEPSITTYAKGSTVTAKNEYLTGSNIYIVVNNGIDITAGTDAKLYTATITPETVEAPAVARPAAQGITEVTVANALAHDGSVTDANGATLTVTAADGLLSDITEIAADDSPTGKVITVDGVKFKPTVAGDYVFEYTVTDDNAEKYATDYNATLPGAIKAGDAGYTFNSFGDANGAISYGSGKVKKISQDSEWTTVLVTSNTPNDPNAANFVGQEFKVKATTITPGTYYQLYTTAGVAQDIYVTTNTSSYTAEEAKVYNATLTGAKTASAIEKTKHYRVIKVVAPAP